MKDGQVGHLENFIRTKSYTLWILILASMLFGIYSVLGIPIEIMPKEKTPPFLFVRVNSSRGSMTPEKMENLLGRPVEAALRSMPKVVRFDSSVDKTGVGVSIYLEPGTNLDEANGNAAEVLQGLEEQGILNSKNISYSRLNPEVDSIIKVALEKGIDQPEKIANTKAQFEAIGEVSKVEVSGAEPPHFTHEITSAKLIAERMTPTGLQVHLAQTELRDSLGDLETPFSQTSISASLKPETYNELIQRPVSREHPVSLSQLGEGVYHEKFRDEIFTRNGRNTIFMEIYAREGANLFQLSEKVKAVLTQSQSGEPILNKVDDVESALREVFSSLWQAILITCVVVWLFYRDVQKTILVSLSIPITLLLTIPLMYLKGASLNLLSLSGLILGIGMVVDNAVLVIGRTEEILLTTFNPNETENHRAKRAAGGAARDVFLPLVLSSLTNAIIFLPVAFIETGDSFTDLLKALQVPILSSLMASLFVAFLVMPALLILWPLKVKSRTDLLSTEDRFVAGSLEARSESLFRWMQRHSFICLTLAFLVAGTAVYFVRGIDSSDLGVAPDPYHSLVLRFTPEVREVDRRKLYEEFNKELLAMKSQYAFLISEFNPKNLSGSWSVFPLKSTGDGDLDHSLLLLKRHLDDFVAAKKGALIAGSHLSIGWDAWGSGVSRQKSIVLEIAGPESSVISEVVHQLQEEWRQVKGVTRVSDESEQNGQRALFFKPNLAVLASQGRSLSQVAGSVSQLLGQISLSLADQKVQINLVPEIGKEWDLEYLQTSRLVNFEELQAGGKTPSFGFLQRGIRRKEGVASQKVYLTLDSSLEGEALSAVKSNVYRVFSNFSLPKGYAPPIDESQKRLDEMREKSNFILGLSAILIYMLLASLFESILVPLGMMMTVPLALVFGAVSLIPFGYDLDVMARLGLVILVGIGVNGAIILIDKVRNLKEEGIPRLEAVVKGCAGRLRAVLLTTTIQVVSVLPVAMGQSKLMGIPYSTLGIVIIFGMSMSTLITLVVLPLVYGVLDRWESGIEKH